jgi:hypothetical protein
MNPETGMSKTALLLSGKTRLLVCAALSATATGLAYGLAVVGKVPSAPTLAAFYGLLVYPGFKMSLLVFPEGIHAGRAFLIVSALINWVFYGVVLFLLVEVIWRRRSRV